MYTNHYYSISILQMYSTNGWLFLAHKVCADLLPLLKFALPDEFPAHIVRTRPNGSSIRYFIVSSVVFLAMDLATTFLWLGFMIMISPNGPCYYFPLARIHDNDIPKWTLLLLSFG